MKVLVQKCKMARVTCEGETREIQKGFVLFVSFTQQDQMDIVRAMAKKVAYLRIFEDEAGVMNLSLLDVFGSVLSISQFTLYANTEKGNRPSYVDALNGKDAKVLYDAFNEEMKKYVPVEVGFFGQHMEVSLINDGPTTILLEKSTKES